LKSLEHRLVLDITLRYDTLHDEKLRNEVEYKNRNDFNLKTVASLRAEIDNLKAQNTERHIELQEMRAEFITIKEIADHRV
jgi:hypothetical protein